MSASHDLRLQALTQWLDTVGPERPVGIEPASADASFRRYFRVHYADGQTLIVMDAPPAQEDCRPFLHVRALFAECGARVPEVHAQDLDRGFLLLSDLGRTTYLAALATLPADPLYRAAGAALVAIQAGSRAEVLPDYDRGRLQAEMELFPEWYVGRHLGVSLTDAQHQQLKAVFDRVLTVNLAEARVFVHRDYHSRNLMLGTGPLVAEGAPPGILDFQDAVYGPVSYDLVSLLKDAYVDWDEEQVLDWLIRYWELARQRGVPVPADFARFHEDFEWMGVQRHLKVLGIFARLYHRDGKDGYLADMPRVESYLYRTCRRYRELMPLAALLDELANRRAQAGYTF